MADRYWVGGGGTWNNNSGGRWSNVSGGGGGYGNPGPTDNAIFDANSGGGTVNVAVNRNCYNLLLNGFTGTFTGAVTTDLIIYGDTVTLTGPSGISMPGNGPRLWITSGYSSNIFNFYSYGSTIGHILNNGRTFYLQQHATSKNNTQILNYGNFYLNGYDLTIGIYDNESYLDLGSGLMQVIMAQPPNSMPVVFNQVGSVSAASGILRFTRARVTGALSSSMTSSQTTLTLVDSYLDNNQTVWPSSGMIQIENEILSYTSISSGVKSVTLSGLTRGLYYSAPASHAQYKSVLLLGPYFTTLSSSASSSDTTLYVTDNSQFPGNGYLEVGGEIIAFSGKSGTTAFTGLTRGQTTYGGTSAASHASGTTVRHMEGRQMSFNAGGTFGTVEFGTNGCYMLNLINNNPTFTIVRAGPYLPTNPIGMSFIQFVNSPTITNFRLGGTRPIQGIIAQPVYVQGKTGTNTSTTIYGLSGYPNSSVLPYTYTGVSETDFFDFLGLAGATFGASATSTSYGGVITSISYTLSYSLGAGGAGGYDSNNGASGGTTTATLQGVTITASGGLGGYWNSYSTVSGGSYSGGDGGASGGNGYGASGDMGGGGGGGIAGNNGGTNGNAGGTGGSMGDVSGLQTALVAAGGTVGTGGAGADAGSSNTDNMNGSAGSGYGAGGGGAGWYGGRGGAGSYGGGGGGAAGYTASEYGGAGGGGFIVINYGSTYVVITSGSSYSFSAPPGTSIKVWAVGGGGGGAGSEASDGNSGGGGAAGGIVYKTWPSL